MTAIDRFLQRWRIAKAIRHIPSGARVLDIGSYDGPLFHALGDRLGSGLGVDPTLPGDRDLGRIQLKRGLFPEAVPADSEPFDAITMLAVLEHFPETAYAGLSAHCARFLKPGGKVIITVPSGMVDRILAVLQFCRLIDGMSLEQHHGYDTGRTPEIFAAHFRLVHRERFQFGLNNLFLFEKL